MKGLLLTTALLAAWFAGYVWGRFTMRRDARAAIEVVERVLKANELTQKD